MSRAEEFDLVLTGGDVFDPDVGRFARRDLGIRDGIVVDASGPSASAKVVVDVTGRMVVPGLIDAHSHVYPGATANGISADSVCPAGGVTTTVDGGSSGSRTFEGFARCAATSSSTRVLCYINLSCIGLSASRIVGELANGDLADPDGVRALIIKYPEMIVGIKVRISRTFCGGPSKTYVQMAAEVAREVGSRLHLHIGDSVEPMSEVLGWLSAGDMVTHYQTPKPNGLFEHDGSIIEAAWAARERGVVFDCGHGTTHFSFANARRLLAEGLAPDTLSSDQSRHGDGPFSAGLVQVMSEWIALGMPLEEVLRAVTANSADALGLGRHLGRLRAGYAADVTILDRDERSIVYRDAQEAELAAAGGLVVVGTIKAGQFAWSSPALS